MRAKTSERARPFALSYGEIETKHSRRQVRIAKIETQLAASWQISLFGFSWLDLTA